MAIWQLAERRKANASSSLSRRAEPRRRRHLQVTSGFIAKTREEEERWPWMETAMEGGGSWIANGDEEEMGQLEDVLLLHVVIHCLIISIWAHGGSNCLRNSWCRTGQPTKKQPRTLKICIFVVQLKHRYFETPSTWVGGKFWARDDIKHQTSKLPFFCHFPPLSSISELLSSRYCNTVPDIMAPLYKVEKCYWLWTCGLPLTRVV